MLAKRIIPCLDVDNGRVVKGVQFLDIRDAGDPVCLMHCGDAIASKPAPTKVWFHCMQVVLLRQRRAFRP